jgi:hypothetical protein
MMLWLMILQYTTANLTVAMWTNFAMPDAQIFS